MNNNSTNLPSVTSTNVPSLTPVSSRNVPRFNPYSMDGNALSSNVQNVNVSQQSVHSNGLQTNSHFYQQLSFQHSNPFLRTVPTSQYQNQAGNAPGPAVSFYPLVITEEGRALIRMYQHTEKEITEEKKRVHGLKKRDLPEFPANKDLTPEKYIEYRQYFLMIAQYWV